MVRKGSWVQVPHRAFPHAASASEVCASVAERMPEIPDRDLPGALRNVAVAKGIDVDKTARARQNQQKPCLLWFTGFSGSGKSTTRCFRNDWPLDREGFAPS